MTGSAAVAEGMGSEAAGSGSRALGLYARARLAGQTAAAQGRFVAAGDAQEAVYRMAIAKSNATPAELRIAGTGRLLVDAGRTMSCLVNVVARSSSGDSASFLRRVVVKNVAGVVSLVGSVETIGTNQKDAGAAAGVVAVYEANDPAALMINSVSWQDMFDIQVFPVSTYAERPGQGDPAPGRRIANVCLSSTAQGARRAHTACRAPIFVIDSSCLLTAPTSPQSSTSAYGASPSHAHTIVSRTCE